jgi:hypothetical protein
MKLRCRQVVIALTLVSLLTLGLTANSAPTQNVELPGAEANALRTLSEYLVGSYDAAGKLLKKYDYVPPPAIAQFWHRYPAIKKLEYAYLAAETATPGTGGDKLLALLTQDLAEQYESVRRHKSLSYYAETKLVIEPPPFKNPSPIPDRINLAAKVTTALDALSNYCVRGPLGSPQRVLVKYFNLSESDAYQVLAQSDTYSEAFKRAMNRVSAEQQLNTLKTLTSNLVVYYEALTHEPSLVGLKLVEPPPEILLTPPTRPEVPERLASMPSAQARFGVHMETTYQSAASREFSSMASSFRGFGGVVFGNEVKAEVGPSRLFSIFIGESDTPGMVTVWCHFEDGMAGLPNVRAGDAYAAAEIYYPSKDTYTPPSASEGVGLVGIEDAVPYVDCHSSGVTAKRGKQFNVVMHPALKDLDLAWAALTTDMAPIEPEALVERARLGKTASAETASEAIERLFNSLESQTEVSLGTWKIVDVPMTISRKGNVLSISRTADGTADFPEGLLKNAFLEMRNMTVNQLQAMFMDILGEEAILKNEYDLDFANEFYRLLPVLTKISADYERMNRFAPVLGLFRWARSQRALLPIRPDRTGHKDTPDAVLTYGGNVTAIPPFKELEAYKQALRITTACMERALQSPVVADYRRAAQPILEQMQSQLKIYRTGKQNSEEVRRAEDELYRLLIKLKSLSADKPEIEAWRDLRELSRMIENGIAELEAANRSRRPADPRRRNQR